MQVTREEGAHELRDTSSEARVAPRRTPPGMRDSLEEHIHFLWDITESAWANVTQTSCDRMTAANIWVALIIKNPPKNVLCNSFLTELFTQLAKKNSLETTPTQFAIPSPSEEVLKRNRINKRQKEIQDERSKRCRRITWWSAHSDCLASRLAKVWFYVHMCGSPHFRAVFPKCHHAHEPLRIQVGRMAVDEILYRQQFASDSWPLAWATQL